MPATTRRWLPPCGYHFEYDDRKLDAGLFRHDEDATSGVVFTFPTEYLLEHGPAHMRALALELVREMPFSFGYASLAAVAPHGMWLAARTSPSSPSKASAC